MRKIKDQAVCDFRGYDAKALRKIKSIKDVALLILPKDADSDFMETLASIKTECVAETIYLDKNVQVKTISGSFELSDNTIPENDNSIYQVNGTLIIHHLSPNRVPALMVNGFIIIHEPSTADCNVNFMSVNGNLIRITNLRFRYFPNKVELTANDLEYFEEDTTIVCGDKIILDETVTNDVLQGKKLFFVAGNKILCSEKSISYIKANSQVGNKIVLGKDDEEKR